MSVPTLFLDGRVVLHGGDCRDVVAQLPDASIDAVVTDPPYALVSIVKRFGGASAAAPKDGDVYARGAAGFMGRAWDTGEVAFDAGFWREILRVLKPGGHVASFGGTRSHHRMWCAIEDAGFEIRDSLLDLFDLDPVIDAFFRSLDAGQQQSFLTILDHLGPGGMLAWAYGSGFPKSHDVAKGIDRHNRDVRPVVGRERLSNDIRGGALLDVAHGGTRPAFERDVTSAASAAWQGWGTALKPAWEPICLARKPLVGTVAENVLRHGTGALNIDGCRVEGESTLRSKAGGKNDFPHEDDAWTPRAVNVGSEIGRWPANIVHDGSDEVAAAFGDAPGQQRTVRGSQRARGDAGSAARFFYSVKADADDRIGSKHPTVKPVDLKRWLCRMICPPGGTVLDPFAGTGTTGEAAFLEGFFAVLIEREAEYRADIARRMALILAGPATRKGESVKARARAPSALPLFGFSAEAGE